MPQLDFTSLTSFFDVAITDNVDFNTGVNTPFSYTWTSTNLYDITAFGYLGDFTPGLAGTVNGIYVTDGSSSFSVLGLDAPLTNFIDSTNDTLNHEKFWDSVLAGESEMLMPLAPSALHMMGDFVRVATGQTRTGAKDTFTGAQNTPSTGGTIVGDALDVNAGGTLHGGADRFTNVSIAELIGDVGGMSSANTNSGTVYGGDDVFFAEATQPDFTSLYFNQIIGDVKTTGDGGTSYGGDDVIRLLNATSLAQAVGDNLTVMAGTSTTGGDDLFEIGRTGADRYLTSISILVGDVANMSVSAGAASTVTGGDDKIFLDGVNGSSVNGDFYSLYHQVSAYVEGGDDLIVLEDTYYEHDPEFGPSSLSVITGDAYNINLSGGGLVSGDDTIRTTNVSSSIIVGDVQFVGINGSALMTLGSDVIEVMDGRTNYGFLPSVISGDLQTGSISSNGIFTFGHDSITVVSERAPQTSLYLYGDAEGLSVMTTGTQELLFGDDSLVYTGNDGIVASGDASVSGSVDGGDLIVRSGSDYIKTGAGNDILRGDADVNSTSLISGSITQYGGNDTLDGGLGNDSLIGGLGLDTASFASVAQAVTVFLDGIGGGPINAVGQGSDTFDGIENVIGSSRDDLIVGDGSDNVIEGGAGADNLVGNGGIDTLSYASSTGFVNVSIETGYVGGGSGSHAIGDTFLNGAGQTSFRNLIGSEHDDILNGDDFDNYIFGGDGDDYLRGRGQQTTTAGGGDTLDGGEGSDWVDYADNATNINVSLATGFANGGPNTDALGDVFISIENIRGTNFGDRMTGDANDNIFEGRSGNDTLIGGAGSDTADYMSSGSFVNVSLLSGFAGGGASSHAIGDTFTSIENLYGSAFGDILNGDNGNNILRGRAGGDTLNGNGGIDTADYTDSAGSVNVSLLSGFAGGGAGSHAIGDTFSSIENLIGSRFGDILNGDNGNNLLEGKLGADVLRGNGGIDTATYASSSEGVNVSLATNFTLGGDAAGDTFDSIENVTGSAFNDVLSGDTADNVLSGMAGNDILRGRLGADTLDGGADRDVADYADASGAVNVSLNTGFTAGAHAAGDIFVSIEGLTGSAFNDRLTGDAGDNILKGGAGNDTLVGLGGSDDFIFGAGFGNDTITDFQDGSDMLIFAGNAQINDVSDLNISTVGADALVEDGFGNSILIEGAAGDISGADMIFDVTGDLEPFL
ncbi:beta strand repeat-containing protein [Ponticoccus alexandrii]|uniref:Calcium-binding protein n=1 Tax=Ponticoccus alexandrii TaxID=1943633 RepID=A0ABX7FDG7_9RHOB|nr:hypothetical protein [Ponticoccus alexandrii]QRF68631.1 hypothetical protein GQA70_19790 [Ponticoccus alexandrii]